MWAEPEFNYTVVAWEVTALHALLPLAMNPRGGRLPSLTKLGFTRQMPTFFWVMLGYIPLNPTFRRQRQETAESLKPSYLEFHSSVRSYILRLASGGLAWWLSAYCSCHGLEFNS